MQVEIEKEWFRAALGTAFRFGYLTGKGIRDWRTNSEKQIPKAWAKKDEVNLAIHAAYGIINSRLNWMNSQLKKKRRGTWWKAGMQAGLAIAAAALIAWMS